MLNMVHGFQGRWYPWKVELAALQFEVGRHEVGCHGVKSVRLSLRIVLLTLIRLSTGWRVSHELGDLCSELGSVVAAM